MDQDLTKFFYSKTTELEYRLATRTLQFSTEFGLLQDTKHYNDFPYKDADSLYFNLIDNSGQYEYDNQFYSLTNDDKEILKNWILEYFNNKENRIDIYLPCYDPNDNNLYKGNFTISQLEKFNYKFTDVNCGYSVGRYNENTDKWEEIYAIIKDDGSYLVNPGSYCERCVLFFTKEEWEKIQPSFEDEDAIIQYDFIKNTWVDSRTVEDMKDTYRRKVMNTYSYLISLEFDYYLDLDRKINDNILKLFIDESKIDLSFYTNGSNNIINLFKDNLVNEFKPRIIKYNDFNIDFYIEKYFEAKKYLEGQRDVWVKLPTLIDNNLFDLNTINGWKQLIHKFELFIDNIYDEYVD